MTQSFPDLLSKNIRWLGLLAIIICFATWMLDITDVVYVCPYCRTQRTAIGFLGLIMMLPNPRHWLSRYLATIIAFLGAHVAAAQHFGGWKKVSAGTWPIGEQWYLSSFLLSGIALAIITAQIFLIHMPERTNQNKPPVIDPSID